MTNNKVYVCYINHGFIHHDIQRKAFTNIEDAEKWAVDINKKITQIVNMKDAAEKRYRDRDPEKYEMVMREAVAFANKEGFPWDAWLANFTAVEYF